MSALSLENRVLVALRRITRAIDLNSRGLMQGFGLTTPQLAALRAIDRLQPVTAGALAKSIHLSQATLSGILARLETRGLVTRGRASADRRAVVVQLTSQGDTVLQSAPSLLHDRFRRGLHELHDWEQSQLLSTLERVAAMMESDNNGTSQTERVSSTPDSAPITERDKSLPLQTTVTEPGASRSLPNSLMSKSRSSVQSPLDGDPHAERGT